MSRGSLDEFNVLQFDPQACSSDNVQIFDSGQTALNQYLQRFALTNQKANSAQTYVCCQDGVVVGFYSLAVGSG